MKKILASHDINTNGFKDFDSIPDSPSYPESKNVSNPYKASNRNSFDSKEENISYNGIPESHFDIINQIDNDPEENKPLDYFCENERKNDVSMLGKKRKNDSEIEEKNETVKKFKNEKNIEEKDTKDTTAKIGKNIIKKNNKFETYNQTKKANYKKFNYIKKLKKFFQEFLIEISENFIINEFPNELNQLEIEKNTSFIEDGNEKSNKATLSSKIINFYPLIKIEKHNKIKIKKEVLLKELKDGELKNFLNKTLEDMYKEYYKSQKFKEFSSNDDVKRFDAQLRRETKEKFSFLKPEGFIKYLKNEY